MYAWARNMTQKTLRFPVLALLLLAAAAAGAAAPPSPQDARAKLDAVRARIAEMTRRRAQELAARDEQGARLRDAELKVTAKRQALEDLQAATREVAQRRSELQAERQHARAALDAERAQLAAQIRAAALLGRQQEIRLLLNQTDARRAGRMLALENYFGRARAASIAAINAQLANLDRLTGQIEIQSARYQSLMAQASGELRELLDARAARATLLANLAGQVQSADQELSRLRREEQSVETLLAELAAALQNFPTDPGQGFAALRGRLPWPVKGRLKAAHHELRADSSQGGLRWNGVLIEAPKGSRVRAPYFGRVIYADWLQGLGLLLIISHSGGYLSLYGHAEILYKSVGDQVAPGDVIAALPEGGDGNAQLYFEIRQGRTPVDPRSWLR